VEEQFVVELSRHKHHSESHYLLVKNVKSPYDYSVAIIIGYIGRVRISRSDVTQKNKKFVINETIKVI